MAQMSVHDNKSGMSKKMETKLSVPETQSFAIIKVRLSDIVKSLQSNHISDVQLDLR